MAKKEDKQQQRRSEKIGYAEFGAFLHRNDGGKINVSAYTSVNEKLKVDAAGDTAKIAHRRFNIYEEEVPELHGNKFYSKDVWTDQTEASSPNVGQWSGSTTPYAPAPAAQPSAGPATPGIAPDPSPLAVLKNFVDNIAADVRNHGWMILGITVIAVAGFVIAVMK